MSDELMVEGKSKLSVLVLEHEPESAANALSALRGHDVIRVTNLHDAMDRMIGGGDFDIILSVARLPVKEGEEPTAIVSEVISMCYGSGTPTCFIARTDEEGSIGGDGHISLKSFSSGRVFATILESSGGKRTEQELFSELKTSEAESIRCGSKTPEIWERALRMAANASVEVSSFGKVIRFVRKSGYGVDIKDGTPRIIPKK